MLPDGRSALIVSAKLVDIYRDGEASISDAVRSGKAHWPIYEEFAHDARVRKVGFVGVRCKENGDLWLASADLLFRRGSYKPVLIRGRMMRALPFSAFRRRLGSSRRRK